MFDDLRQFLDKARELGECKLIESADWDLEIGLISELQMSRPNQPLLLFDKIKGSKPGYRVATNAIETERRFALVHGLPLEAKKTELVNVWRNKLKQPFSPVSPVVVKTGRVEENVQLGDEVDLLKFPTPKWHHLDGGRYIGTGDVVIQKDPDEGWTNLGTYRVQVHDKTTATIHIVKGRHGDLIRQKYWAKGLSCPVAVVCGGDPQLFSIASSTLCPVGLSEYDYVGWLKGRAIEVVKGKTVDLLVPAAAEIVLEGEIMPPGSETRDEGPFGEWEGYYAGGLRSEPILKVNCVMHRNDPIILGQPPLVAPFATYACWSIHRAAGIWNDLDRQLPGVKGVWCPNEVRSPIMIVVSIQQMYTGHAKQAAMVVAGSYSASTLGRFIVIVDDDIDPSSMSDVLWALGTRCDPESSIDIIGGFRGQRSDPILSPEKKNRGELFYSRAIIYACKPYHWIKEFPPSIKSSAEALAKTKEKWSEVLFGGT